MLRTEMESRWADAFLSELTTLGKTEADLDLPPNAQPWKLALARNLRDKHGASTSWIAKRMRLSSPSYLRKLLSES